MLASRSPQELPPASLGEGWRYMTRIGAGIAALGFAICAAAYTSSGAGYVVADNAEPGGPSFQWDDIAGAGTRLPLGQDTSTSVSLPFNFRYFGVDYSGANVCDNGYIQFGGASVVANGAPIPSAGAPDNMICAFWDDLDPSTRGEVRVAALGSSPNRRFVISWIDVPRTGDQASSFTFQVALFEGGSIRLQYQSVSAGASPPVGIENLDGSAGLPYPAGSLHAGLAVGFYPGGASPPWELRSIITTSGFLNATTYGGSIHGTASDPLGVGIASVGVSIRRASDSLYWDGLGWQAVETWVTAGGTAVWSYAFAPADGETYALQSRALSTDGREESPPASSSFTYDIGEPNSIVTTAGALSSATYGGAIAGTASDIASGVKGVEITIHRMATSQYWSGMAWGVTPVWLAAAGTTVWSYGFAPENLQTYEVFSRATDMVGNVETTPGQSTFSYNLSGPDSAVLTGGWAGVTGWNGIAGTATTTGGAVVTRVDIVLHRQSDNRFWNGSGWGAAPMWLPAAGTASWNFAFAPEEGVTYDVESRATDSYGNAETSFGLASFMFDGAGPAVVISTGGTYTEGDWTGDVDGTAADAVSGVQKVEIALQRVSDGFYWSGVAWSPTPIWLQTFGTVRWTRDASFARVGQEYVAEARAMDMAGNMQNGTASRFSIVPDDDSGDGFKKVKGRWCSLGAGGGAGGLWAAFLAVLALGAACRRARLPIQFPPRQRGEDPQKTQARQNRKGDA